MKRHVKDRQKVTLLEHQLQDLQLQKSRLEEERHALAVQESIAQDWCDTLLALLRRMSELQGSADPDLLEALSELAAQEASPLLPPDSAAPHCTIKTISPLSAPCTRVKELIARDPVPSAASMTALQVAEVCRETTLQSGVLLLQMPQQSNRQKQDSVRTLEQLWDRCVSRSVASSLQHPVGTA